MPDQPLTRDTRVADFARQLLTCVVGFLLSVTAFAGEVALLEASSYLNAESEATTLTSEESRHLSRIRSSSNIVATSVAKVNVAALTSDVITVVTPAGQRLRYTKYEVWHQKGGPETWNGRAEIVDPRAPVNTLLIVKSGRHLAARLLGEVNLSIDPLGDRYHTVVEHKRLPEGRVWKDDTPPIVRPPLQ